MKTGTGGTGRAGEIARGICTLTLAMCAGILASPAWATSVSLTSPPTSVIAAPATITLSATATPSAGRRILRVDFYRGITRLGTVSSPPYSIVWSDVPLGNYILTAVAIDSGGSFAVSGPVAVRVDNPPTVSLTAPASGTVFAPGTNIPLAANASDSDGVVRKVEFFTGSTLIGTNFLPPYNVLWNSVPAGIYSITARATDLAGLVGISAPVTITVDAAPTVAITSPATGAIFTAPANITVSATASDSDGIVTKVDFFDGTTFVGTASGAPGSSTYSVTLNNLTAGNHILTARATDDQGVTTSSSEVSVIVKSAVAQIYYIHPDHLNTPRMITDGTGTTVWRWDQGEPFGNDVPNSNPSGAGAFDFPLRFPGQYFDRETSLVYNFFRDYDPTIGRYIQSDPIGLEGGINTFLYVHGNPNGKRDRTGLIAWPVGVPFPRPAPPPTGPGGSTGGQSGGSGLPAEFDPTRPRPQTFPEVQSPPNYPTTDPSDCDKRFEEDLDACKETCPGVTFSRIACIAAAYIKYRWCRRLNNPAGSDWTNW